MDSPLLLPGIRLVSGGRVEECKPKSHLLPALRLFLTLLDYLVLLFNATIFFIRYIRESLTTCAPHVDDSLNSFVMSVLVSVGGSCSISSSPFPPPS